MKFNVLTRIQEVGALDPVGRSARVVIISEGLGNLRDRNFYSAEAVASAVAIFNGKQFYIDHPSQSDEQDRPERSVRDLAGYFYDCSLGEVEDPESGERLKACFGTLKFDESASGQLAFDKVKTAIEYQKRFPNSKDVYAGISLNAGGASHPGTIDGQRVNVVTEIAEAFSADIVTKPARGGKFLALTQESFKAAARYRAKEARGGPRAGHPLREQRRQFTKEQVNFRQCSDCENKRCGICKNFQAPSSCRIVAGMILKTTVCDKFEPKTASNTDSAPKARKPMGMKTEAASEPAHAELVRHEIKPRAFRDDLERKKSLKKVMPDGRDEESVADDLGIDPDDWDLLDDDAKAQLIKRAFGLDESAASEFLRRYPTQASEQRTEFLKRLKAALLPGAKVRESAAIRTFKTELSK